MEDDLSTDADCYTLSEDNTYFEEKAHIDTNQFLNGNRQEQKMSEPQSNENSSFSPQEKLHSGSTSENKVKVRTISHEASEENLIGDDVSQTEDNADKTNESTLESLEKEIPLNHELGKHGNQKQEQQNHYIHPLAVNRSGFQQEIPSGPVSETELKSIDSSPDKKGEIISDEKDQTNTTGASLTEVNTDKTNESEKKAHTDVNQILNGNRQEQQKHSEPQSKKNSSFSPQENLHSGSASENKVEGQPFSHKASEEDLIVDDVSQTEDNADKTNESTPESLEKETPLNNELGKHGNQKQEEQNHYLHPSTVKRSDFQQEIPSGPASETELKSIEILPDKTGEIISDEKDQTNTTGASLTEVNTDKTNESEIKAHTDTNQILNGNRQGQQKHSEPQSKQNSSFSPQGNLHSGSASENKVEGQPFSHKASEEDLIVDDVSQTEDNADKTNESSPESLEKETPLNNELGKHGNQKQEEHNHYLHPSTGNRSGFQQEIPSGPASETELKSIEILPDKTGEKNSDEKDQINTTVASITEVNTDKANVSILKTNEAKATCIYESGSGEPDSTHRKEKMEPPTKKTFCLPPNPPLDWRLNKLLDEIALTTDEYELERIKLLFTGHEGIGKRTLEECKTCRRFFYILKQRGYLSRDNILYLNNILYTLGRKDLIEKAVEYCREEGDVISYYSSNEQPGSGRKSIKLHVNADVQTFDKTDLEKLLYFTARLVCIPVEEIEISAVAPGSSFMITFIMPEMYVDILQHLLERKVNIGRLTALGVDNIIIADKQYDVSGLKDVTNISQQCREIMNVYEQLDESKKELEKMEILNLEYHEELTNARTQLEKVDTIIIDVDHCDVSESSLRTLNALLEEVTSSGQDIKLIKKMIKASTEIVAACLQNRNDLDQKERAIKMDKMKVIDLELRHALLSSVKTAGEVLVEKYDLLLKDHNFAFNLRTAEALRRLSETISDEHRTTLMNMYTWSRDELIKECIDADNGLILLGLECKEAILATRKIDTNDMLDRVGKRISCDLCTQFNTTLLQLKREEFNQQLIRQLEQKSKTPQDIIILFAERLFDVPHNSLKVITQKCKTLYNFLNASERAMLLDMIVSQDTDAVWRCIAEDESLLIPGLLFKDMERIESICPEKFLSDIQRKIERRDLVMLYRQLDEDEESQMKQIRDFEEKRSKESRLFQKLIQKEMSGEEVLRSKLTHFTLKLGEKIDTGPEFTTFINILREISALLSRDESDKLLRKRQWGDNDVIEACIQRDRTLLVQGLFQKEIEDVQAVPNQDKFVLSICKEVKRVCIYQQYKEQQKFELLLDDNMMNHLFGKVSGYVQEHFECSTPEQQPVTRKVNVDYTNKCRNEHLLVI